MLPSRIQWDELSLSRAAAGLRRRAADLPHRVAWRASAEARGNRMRLGEYRDRHRGQRCIILGNGPSLAKMDLAPLRDELTFGSNRVYLLFEKLGFETSYYCALNPLVLRQFAPEILRLRMPKFLAWSERARLSGAENALFLRDALALRDFFARDPRRSICAGGTVTYVALQLAFFMGFRQAILVGVDHSFSERGEPNRVALRTSERDADHFHPDYFPKGSRWQLPDLGRSERAYALARATFEADGRQVLDATEGGRLQVFEKADFRSLFEP